MALFSGRLATIIAKHLNGAVPQVTHFGISRDRWLRWDGVMFGRNFQKVKIN